MDRRMKQILDILSDRDYCTAEMLAQQIHAGTKTVRNLLKEISQEIEPYGAGILSKYGVGYFLNIQDHEKYEAYCRESCARGLEEYLPSTSEERVQYLLEYLINSESYAKLEELSESLYISKRTLTEDLKEVEQFLNKFNIRIIRKPNYGIRLEGKEFDTRLCIASFSGKRLHKGNESMDEIAAIVSMVLKENDFLITGAAYQNLVVHLYIAISRIMESHYVPMPEGLLDNPEERYEYHIAKSIAAKLEERFHLSFPENEVIYIAIHLAGKKMFLQEAGSGENVIITQEISDLVTAMLERVYDLFKFDFRSDLELRMILSQHLVPLSVRIRFDMDMKNPMLRDVKEKFCLSYTMSCNAVTVLNEHFKVSLSEDEVAYFAFAFALALERKKTEIKKKNIILVCSSGRGSAQLLQYKYKNSFKDYIDDIIACDVGSLYKMDFSRYDYIFTTVPITLSVPLPILEVEYFLGDEDIVNVKKALCAQKSFSVRNYYERELFLPHLKFRTKTEVLRFMCQFVIEKKNLPEEFYESVLRRERVAKTAFGNQVAMPHAYKAMSSETFVCVGILDEPVEWGDQKIRAVFLVCIADKDHTSAELQHFYQLTASFLLSQKQIQELVKKQDFDAFIKAMAQMEETHPM
ncbi:MULTISPECIES: BglG family transcription antiterminator [Lacrimispora]|uniref:BglG family transcription antiterminator n=1 Tax=Lacrimispora TaxID=2719231 RepID=UPI000BE2F442|nr:BglG family transcription antiterminator [Lacrimispora amygdalina]MDK2967893.1 putative licABCH operon transcriptional regulator [Lacrimispora sp.]